MSAQARDDSSIDIMEFIGSDDDSIFQPKMKKIKSESMMTKIKSDPGKAKRKSSAKDTKIPKRKRKPKPADMPRRPLSAYNIFFKEQRALIIGAPNGDHKPRMSQSQNFLRKKRAHRKTHGKISFSNLAKEIGKKWNSIPKDGRAKYIAEAAKEKLRYQEELRIYKLKKVESKVIKMTIKPSRSDIQENAMKWASNHEKSHNHRNFTPYDDSSSSPHGLEVEFNSRSIPENGEPNEEYLNDFNPLPITYDPLCHPTEHIDNTEMVKLVAPLLQRKKRNHSRRCLPVSHIRTSDTNILINTQGDIRVSTRPGPYHQPESTAESENCEILQSDQGMDDLLTMFLPSSEEKKYDQNNDYPTDCRGNLFPL